VARAVEHARVKKDNAKLRSALAGQFDVQGIVGRSQAMKDVVAMLERIAPSDVPILIEGESGTGKDLLARAAHAMSRRAAGPYVSLNMSAIPENLAEAELFGHEKGAFTGAEQARAGFFAEAEGGTLFLDELGLLPPGLQPKLLRVLQDGEYIPVGSRKPRKANVRVIAATNEDLARNVKEGKFREDLWFRLRVVPLRLPPLRERREDIPLLVVHFLNQLTEEGVAPRTMAPEATERLQQLDWPGNVRELRNTIERLLILSAGPRISGDDVSRLVGQRDPEQAGLGSLLECKTFEEFKHAAERAFLLAKLREFDWNVSETARALDMPRSNLYKKIERYRLTRETAA
jgi:two-component system, NtrC family, response regulator AtoC